MNSVSLNTTLRSDDSQSLNTVKVLYPYIKVQNVFNFFKILKLKRMVVLPQYPPFTKVPLEASRGEAASTNIFNKDNNIHKY